MLMRIQILLLVGMMTLTSGATARADAWITYDPSLGTLPQDQGFTFFDDGPPEVPAPEVVDGVLHQGLTGSGCSINDQWWSRDDVPIDFDETFVLEATLRVISSNYIPSSPECGQQASCPGGEPAMKVGYVLAINDLAGRKFSIGIADTGVFIDTGCCACAEEAPLQPLDTTDGFHDYYFVVSKGVGSLFIDGGWFHSVPVGTFAQSGVPNRVMFGDGTHQGQSETELQLFRYSTELPVNCEGDANGDGAVDPLDSGYVLARFGCPVGTGDPDCDAADQNGDGAVDPLDSGFVLARFGQCP